MIFVWYTIIFFLGAAIGSFLNVAISRSVEGKDWVGGRSHCDNCGKTLEWYDMIPLLSYLFYRGKSRCCDKALSLQHPTVELLIGLLFVWWVVVGSFFFRLVTHPLSTLQPAFWLVLGIILMVIFVTDLYYGLIPMPAIWTGIILTLGYRLLLIAAHAFQLKDLVLAVTAGIISYVFLWVLWKITKGKGMGDGDPYLAFLLALVVGYPKAVVFLLLSFILGAIIGSFLVVLGNKKMKSTIPFGPFMIISTLITLVWGNKLLTLLF